MHRYSLQRQQLLPAPPHDVFEFFGDARNLEAITPPMVAFRIVTPEPITMGAGALLRYRLRVRGVPLNWLTAIREWDPPHRFVDEQLEGPYALWHHTHTFESDGNGGTVMHDLVQYALPLGGLGDLAHRLFVRNDVERIFDFRAERVADLLGER